MPWKTASIARQAVKLQELATLSVAPGGGRWVGVLGYARLSQSFICWASISCESSGLTLGEPGPWCWQRLWLWVLGWLTLWWMSATFPGRVRLLWHHWGCSAGPPEVAGLEPWILQWTTHISGFLKRLCSFPCKLELWDLIFWFVMTHQSIFLFDTPEYWSSLGEEEARQKLAHRIILRKM